jgi:6-phosphogluconolactonase
MLLPVLLVFLTFMSPSETSHKDYFVYAGTYGKGIYAYRFDANGIKLEPLGLVGEVVNPSFLATDPSFRYLYAASEVAGKGDGAIAGFAINRKTGGLTFLNSRSSAGTSPCHLAVDHTGKMLIAANYGSGSVPVFPVESDGKLGELSGLMKASGASVDKSRQEGPHAHETVISADNRFAYVPDLGLDRIRIYRLEPGAAKLTPNNPPFAKTEPGSGPRHIALSADGKFAYVVHELKPTVSVFSRDTSSGSLTRIQIISTVPEGFTGKSDPAEILMDHSGNFVYASNRTSGTIAVFSIDHSDGKLKQIQVIATGGTMPRGVAIDPTGQVLFVGDQKTNRFVIFQIDPRSGELSLTRQTFEVPSPVAFQFVPAEP